MRSIKVSDRVGKTAMPNGRVKGPTNFPLSEGSHERHPLKFALKTHYLSVTAFLAHRTVERRLHGLILLFSEQQCDGV